MKILDPLHSVAIEALERRFMIQIATGLNRDKLRGTVRDADALVVRSGTVLSADVIDAAENLRVIARAGSGVDNIDLAAAARRGVTVFRIPGESSQAVAELAFALTLALVRRVTIADAQIRRGEWRKPELMGTELFGKTLGVIGAGGIGRRIFEIARGFSMRTVCTVLSHSEEREAKFAKDGIALTSLGNLLKAADIIILALPLTDATRNFIGAEQFALMQPHAVLVNVARAGIVDEHALRKALISGTLAGAALDVHGSESGESPFARLDNVVLTPHIGGMTIEAQTRIARTLAQRLGAALRGEPVPDRVTPSPDVYGSTNRVSPNQSGAT